MYTCMTEGIEGSRESTAAMENVIFLHGFLSSSSFWTETVFPNLSDHQRNNYRLFAVDLLGFGRSPKPRDKLYTLRDHFEMIEKSVISQFDLKSFHLVAHSMGCIIALALAAKHPNIVRSITLVAPPCFPDSRDGAASLAVLKRVAEKRLWPFPTFGTAIMSWYEHLGHIDGYLERLVKSGVKVCVIHGDRDQTAPVECSHYIKTKVPDADINIISKAGQKPVTRLSHKSLLHNKKTQFRVLLGMENFENERVIEDVPLEKFEPTIGMLFDGYEEMFEFYKAYGRQEGFPVKKLTSKKGSDETVKYATFACGRSGKADSRSSNMLKLKPVLKTGCEAKIGGCVNVEGKWILRTLNLQHNHGLSSDKARYFPCNRRISASVKKRIEMNNSAGINIVQNFNFIVVEAGGHENDRLKNVFWADRRSRAAYKYFGDVVTFDTTYLTNKYDMSFAPFVGVNHHGQSILLGCGLISHEDTETFAWLFEAWLSCMSDSPPIGIITDQDKAMQKAIEHVFLTTRHRWCLWHIMKKVPEKLGAFKEREDAKCFSKNTSCVTRYEMEKQVEKMYTIAKFKEFQQELIALMYCDTVDSIGSIYEISESLGQGKKKNFELASSAATVLESYDITRKLIIDDMSFVTDHE
ncbi:putative lysophospholipase BODYGUARD 4 [Citrus sinensis]|uniref:Lysophospholipase BODYGUARD 4 n=1 Tax=Citrus sinensis TaxID=2711 RepID=A0ACB8LBZ7_CITSI|nr:putative lysophospholipase BODYGUARD 4 [Citrus sinensis]